jgi:hypothetical protein
MKLSKKIAIIASIIAGVFVVYIAIQTIIVYQSMNQPSLADLVEYCNYEVNQTTIERPVSDIIENCKPDPNTSFPDLEYWKSVK